MCHLRNTLPGHTKEKLSAHGLCPGPCLIYEFFISNLVSLTQPLPDYWIELVVSINRPELNELINVDTHSENDLRELWVLIGRVVVVIMPTTTPTPPCVDYPKRQKGSLTKFHIRSDKP